MLTGEEYGSGGGLEVAGNCTREREKLPALLLCDSRWTGEGRRSTETGGGRRSAAGGARRRRSRVRLGDLAKKTSDGKMSGI